MKYWQIPCKEYRDNKIILWTTLCQSIQQLRRNGPILKHNLPEFTKEETNKWNSFVSIK